MALPKILTSELDARIAAASALIFDCDGTLVHSGDVYARAWAEGFRLSGGEMAEDWYRLRSGLSESVLLDDFEAAHGVVLDREAVVGRMRRTYLERAAEVAEIAAVTALARRWHGRLPMAVASGGPEAIVRPTLAALGLDRLFDTIVTFDDAREAKPSPALFLLAAKRMGAAPETCLVFEDSPQGLQAAAKAGMAAVDVANL